MGCDFTKSSRLSDLERNPDNLMETSIVQPLKSHFRWEKCVKNHIFWTQSVILFWRDTRCITFIP